MRLPFVNRAAQHVIGTMANVTAGTRYATPAWDVIAMDVDARDVEGKPTDKHFRLLADVHVDFAGIRHWLKRGFQWNGADIPGLFQWLLGVNRYDPRVALASAFHDDWCNKANAGILLRAIGDAMFVSLLMQITFNGRDLDGVGTARAIYMYTGVRAYSAWRFMRGMVAR